MKPTNTPPSKADRGLFFVSLLVFLGTCLLVYGVVSSRGRSAVVYPTATPAEVMTLEPAVVANMTSAPSAVTGDLGIQVDTVERMLNECPEFGTERRQQMQQHIAWLRNPADIPRDLMLAFGAEPTNCLIFGMATYTAIEWRQHNQSPSSCILPIGRLLNEMLVAVGEEPVADFGE